MFQTVKEILSAPKSVSYSIMTLMQNRLTGMLVYNLNITMTFGIIQYTLPHYYHAYGGISLAVVMLTSQLLTQYLMEHFIMAMTHTLKLLIIL